MPPEVAKNTAFYKVNWSDLDKQLSIMDQFHIDKALLLYPTSDAHLNMGGWNDFCVSYNNGIAAVIHQYPDRFIGAGVVPVDNLDTMLYELKRLHDLGLKVISLASSYNGIYLDNERFYPVFEFAAEHSMPVHIHPQIMEPIGEERVKDPLLTPVIQYVFDVTMCIGKMMMSGSFLRFPNVKFIFAHYGGVLPFIKERFDNTYLMLRKREFVKDLGKIPSQFFENLYFDISGANSPAALLGALELTDSSHIIFGSDYPANQNIGITINMVNSLGISSIDKKNILRNLLIFA
jgi:predicted TIM-barrel fold metal-dependent hydrolase